jgi:hypothetical protein
MTTALQVLRSSRLWLSLLALGHGFEQGLKGSGSHRQKEITQALVEKLPGTEKGLV